MRLLRTHIRLEVRCFEIRCLDVLDLKIIGHSTTRLSGPCMQVSEDAVTEHLGVELVTLSLTDSHRDESNCSDALCDCAAICNSLIF